MNPKYRFPILNAIRGNRRLYAAICIPALIVAFAVAFSFESGSQAAVKKGRKSQKNRKFNIEVPGGLELRSIDESLAERQLMLNRRARRSSPISPSAIPAGTSRTSVTFIPDDVSSTVQVVADTNGDLVLDPNATEQFFETDDPNSQLISSMAFGSTTGKYYIGVVDFDGANIGMGQVIITDNSTGNFKSTRNGMFSAGAGTPVGMAVQSTPAGDILYVASVEFSGDRYLDLDPTDGFRVTAYMPGPGGVPDGSMKMDVITKGGLTLGGTAVNRSFGGIAVDDKGNLYLQVGVRTAMSLGGVIIVLSDSDGNMIADMPAIYAGTTEDDPNPATAASLVVLPGGKLAAYGLRIFADTTTQVVIYTDADGDLKADGAPTVFSSLPETSIGIAGSFGEGTSAVSITRMDFADGQALVSLATLTPDLSSFAGSTLSMIKDNGTGVGGAPVTIIEGGSSVPFFTAIIGVPRKGDATPPTVAVVSPNGGEIATGNTMLPISFTSSDNVSVASHDIALSTDGGTTFPITLASGLSGTAQSFNFLVPASIETMTARIQVTAKDAGGNMASDASDANFIIRKPTVADTMPPTVNITAPAAGATLNGGSTTAINFTSTDNVGVSSHNIQFASDGTNFNTTVATGLSGTANSFQFTVPTTASTNAAIRVQAIDSSGNIGSATVGMLKIVSDTVKPTVTVTAPKTKDKLKGGQPFSVTFTSSDNTAVVSHEIQLSKDNGATFATLNTGIPGNVSSFQITVPTGKVKKGVIKVIARDAAGNAGEGVSGVFKIK